MTEPLFNQSTALSPEQRRAVLKQARQRVTSMAIPKLDRRAAAGGLLPGSFGQDRMWFLWRLAPASTTYNETWCYEIAGGLEVGRLAAAVDALVVRHEVLRTTLHEQDGQIVQRIGPPWRCGLTAGTGHSGAGRRPGRSGDRGAVRPVGRPAAAGTSLGLAPDRTCWLFTAHHVVIDEWSLEVFERELWALYAAGGDPASAGCQT